MAIHTQVYEQETDHLFMLDLVTSLVEFTDAYIIVLK